MTNQTRTVSLVVRLTENEQPLIGSRAWVAKVIEESTLEIISCADGRPRVVLVHPTGFVKNTKGNQICRQAQADFGDTPYSEQPSCSATQFDCWPWWDADLHASYEAGPTWLGVSLTKAGKHLARHFARKCRTLLRLALRRNDKGIKTPLKVKISQSVA